MAHFAGNFNAASVDFGENEADTSKSDMTHEQVIEAAACEACGVCVNAPRSR
jgi:hypothetical protein